MRFGLADLWVTTDHARIRTRCLCLEKGCAMGCEVAAILVLMPTVGISSVSAVVGIRRDNLTFSPSPCTIRPDPQGAIHRRECAVGRVTHRDSAPDRSKHAKAYAVRALPTQDDPEQGQTRGPLVLDALHGLSLQGLPARVRVLLSSAVRGKYLLVHSPQNSDPVRETCKQLDISILSSSCHRGTWRQRSRGLGFWNRSQLLETQPAALAHTRNV
jgi:hypothetical protein